MSYLKEMADSGYNYQTIGPFHFYMIPYFMRKYGVRPEEIVVDIGAGQGIA